METTLLLPGKEDESARPDAGLERFDFLKIDMKTARIVDGVSRDAASLGFTPPPKEASDDDLVEMEFENNGRRWRQWTTVGQLRSDFARAGAVTVNRDGRQEFTIPYAWEASDKTRFGATEIALKALKVFGIDIDIKGKVIDKIADPTAKRTAASVAAYFESQIEKYHAFGLYRFDKLPAVGEQITSSSQLSAGEPLLLFLHGTASSSAGSFGKLAGKSEWDELRKAYAGRILALEHRTFSVTPIQNALDVAQLLPDGARLHLVSHSRGGLVGEMLCLGQAGASRAKFDALTERFAGGKDESLVAERETQRQQLKQLWELLEKKKIRVERFVRVACPARGTTLASKRMDVLASAVINAVGFIPGIKENPLVEFAYDLAKATLLALVKQKADPRTLPGIEAMIPDSPIIEFLNDAALVTQADLAVIAGDIEVGNLKLTIPALIGNSFFWAQNDLVVNTRSMSEGMRREGGAVCYFDQGADVSHFNYFVNDDTRRMLQRWLMRGEAERLAEFKPVVRETRVARDGRVEEWLEAEVRPVELFEPYTLQVSVSHGDLRNAKYPVAVGHYDGDGIVSAEKYLDYQLGQRLSKRAGMKLYPGPIGTADVVMGDGNTAPPGALIIGLGEMAQLSPEVVRVGVTTAALRYAAAVYENRLGPEQKEGWRSAAFSSLLIGTYGGNALRIKDAISAVLQGAMQANRILQEQKLWNKVRIDRIELVEIYEDCAIESIHAAHRISEDPPLDFIDKVKIEVSPRELVSIGGGRYQRPPSDHETYWWSRIQVTATKSDGLEFLLLTDRARAEASTQGTQQKLVDQMIERAIDQTRYEPKLSSALFELLIPNALKDQAEHVQLIVDRVSAKYPWELLTERSQPDKPLATRIGILRQFKSDDGRARPQSSRGIEVLVVGDTADSGLAELEGAQDEARRVAELLRGARYNVAELIKKDGQTIINELFAREYRILHIAAHGDFDPVNLDKSGVVLDHGLFLTSKELTNLRTVPDLVFINCCHLGKVETKLSNRSPHRLAASVAEELIRIGVRAVIAAGWAVDDGAATAFADSFYRQMLQGEPFGQAVLRARQETFGQPRFARTNTWGAYQCYGNPNFRLDLTAAQKGQTSARFFSRREYRDELKSIAERTGDSPAYNQRLREQLAEIRKAIPPEFQDGEVLADFADAWRALGDFKIAIELYREAVDRTDAKASINAVERLGNLECRHATQLWRQHRNASPADARKAREEFDDYLAQAQRRFEWVLGLKPTSERHALVGRAHKGLALVAPTATARAASLRQAMKSYLIGYELSLAAQEDGDQIIYPGVNAIACGLLTTQPPKDKLLAIAAKCETAADKASRLEEKVWLRLVKVELSLLRHLIKGDLVKAQAGVLREYKRAFARGLRPSEAESVFSQMEFLADMLAMEERSAKEKAMAAALVKLREELMKGL
ncbi:MAG: CHAT domain-containing protein [Blastocatellia bacterium]|nr:CHAT domain-containing protein [Blastocatellia bacterium]